MTSAVSANTVRTGGAVPGDLPATQSDNPAGAQGVAQSGQVKGVGKTGAGKKAGGAQADYDAADTTASATSTDPEGVLAQPTVSDPTNMILQMTSLVQQFAVERQKNSESDLKANEAEKKQKNEERLDKLKTAIEKQHKAAKHSSIGKIFGWVAVGLMFAVAGIVAVASGGLAAAPLLAAATITLGVMIAQETGGMEKMMDAAGMNAKQKMIFSVGLAVTMLIMNITAAIMSGGAASAGVASASTELTPTDQETGATAA